MRNKMKNKKYLVLFTLFAMNLVDQPAPLVKIEQGILSGKVSADGTYFEYTGIPYATTNASVRFQAPLPPPTWEGVYNAIVEENNCPQYTKFGVIGTEDCLKVNVYVPALAGGPLPVMVFIPGGAFILGSGSKMVYGPDFLIQHDVIIVTFNYRLGALGFLCLGIKEAPGNAGLRDQIAALKWVQKNVAAFGGDPDNVTIFGESAGGTSVALLLATEASEGLFKRAIVQSGSALTLWAINRRPLWTANLLAKEIGYDTNDPYELYDIFSKLPYKELVNKQIIKPPEQYFNEDLVYLPCVEKSFPGLEPIFTDLPYNVLKKKVKNVSIMFGTTSEEGLMFIAPETEDTIKSKNDLYLLSTDLEFGSEVEAAHVAKEVKKFYFDNEQISMKTIMNLSEIYTHLYFEVPVLLESEIYAASIDAPIYNFYFNYSGGRNFLKYNFGYTDRPGACHGDDLLYLFKAKIWPYGVNKNDRRMIEWMTSMWTNFAKYGNPTPKSANLPTEWIPSSKNKLNILYIEDKLKMGSIPNYKAYKLWKSIYEKYRKTLL